MLFEPTISLGSLIGDMLVLVVLLRLYLYRTRVDARMETKIDMLLDLTRSVLIHQPQLQQKEKR
jgi:hypothetical protein